jgi:hypothetical protein
MGIAETQQQTDGASAHRPRLSWFVATSNRQRPSKLHKIRNRSWGRGRWEKSHRPQENHHPGFRDRFFKSVYRIGPGKALRSDGIPAEPHHDGGGDEGDGEERQKAQVGETSAGI